MDAPESILSRLAAARATKLASVALHTAGGSRQRSLPFKPP
jgi:hypothetical protein